MAKRGMRAFPFSDPRSAKGLFLGNNGQLTLGILPVSIFASGHTMFVSRMHEQLDLRPYVVHAVFHSGIMGEAEPLPGSVFGTIRQATMTTRYATTAVVLVGHTDTVTGG
jgi:hypothetical protein